MRSKTPFFGGTKYTNGTDQAARIQTIAAVRGGPPPSFSPPPFSSLVRRQGVVEHRLP
ncbi:MAG: hypothetical protein RR365_06070 [Bacteroides sp.]